MSIILDGFDELSNQRRADIAKEIKEICSQYEHLVVVVSSRYDAGIEHYSFLESYEIVFAEEFAEENDKILRMIHAYANEEDALALSESIPKVSDQIRNLIRNPLMLVLLVVHYAIKKSLPDTIIQFYRDLPDVLINEQSMAFGKTKRPITSGLSSSDLKTFFEAFCYLAVERDRSDKLLTVEVEHLADDAITKAGLSACHKQALDDIISITNLIVREGRYYRFAHRSIKEFNAAIHVASMNQADAKEFYCKDQNQLKTWAGVLVFLVIIDHECCKDMLIAPRLEQLACLDFDELHKDCIKNEMHMLPIILGPRRINFSPNTTIDGHPCSIIDLHIFGLYTSLISFVSNNDGPIKAPRKKKRIYVESSSTFTYGSPILTVGILSEQFDGLVNKLLKSREMVFK